MCISTKTRKTRLSIVKRFFAKQHYQLGKVQKFAGRLRDMMLKKKVNWFLSKKNHWSGRVVECLFLSTAGPKRGSSLYLIVIIRKEKSDVWIFALFSIRYDKHPLFGPAVDKNKHSTTRPDQCFFGQFWLFCQFTLFVSIIW